MMCMNIFLIVVSGILGILFCVYVWFFLSLRKILGVLENEIVGVFLQKIAKIPALIEVMRPYVVDKKAFDHITHLHSRSMIERYEGIYDLLEQNARIQNEFSFLMKLSMRIPELQKHEYFVYIRDFIIEYERNMTQKIQHIDSQIVRWNRFVFFKNCTGI